MDIENLDEDTQKLFAKVINRIANNMAEIARIENMSDAELSQYRVIETKRRFFLVEKDQEGIPANEILKDHEEGFIIYKSICGIEILVDQYQDNELPYGVKIVRVGNKKENQC